MGIIAGILSALVGIAWATWVAVDALMKVSPRSKELVDRWTAKQPLRGLRRALWWWTYYQFPVRHPDGSIGPAIDYTWTRLGRDLRRAGARLVSIVRRAR